jgi:prevent-host-death family protein
MSIVNMHQAKTNLSAIVEDVASGREREVIIARNGVPTVRIMSLPAASESTARRIGIAAGKYRMPETLDANNDEIAALFEGKEVNE